MPGRRHQWQNLGDTWLKGFRKKSELHKKRQKRKWSSRRRSRKVQTEAQGIM